MLSLHDSSTGCYATESSRCEAIAEIHIDTSRLGLYTKTKALCAKQSIYRRRWSSEHLNNLIISKR